VILGNNAIRTALANGSIVCTPEPKQIETHIDVHLGKNFWLPRPMACDVDIATQAPEERFMLIADVAHDQPFCLPSLSFALAHTDEYIGSTVPNIEPALETRSTAARWGITVHVSAGIGDAGYCSRWTLELFNYGPNAILLYPGMRVGIIKFHRVEDNTALYTGRYNTPEADWTPQAMLPRQGNMMEPQQ
jgi:dCTP deaminase